MAQHTDQRSQRRVGSAAKDRDHAAQKRDWSEAKEYHAAKLNLLEVLKDFEGAFHRQRPNASLLDHYCNKIDAQGASVLHVAILCDSDDVATFLIRKYGKQLVNLAYTGAAYEGETALHLAVVKGNLKLVKLLVQHEAAIDPIAKGTFFKQPLRRRPAPDTMYLGSTPLHFGVSTNQMEVVQYLLNHGADPSIQDDYGNNALHLSVYHGQKNMYDILNNFDQGFRAKFSQEDYDRLFGFGFSDVAGVTTEESHDDTIPTLEETSLDGESVPHTIRRSQIRARRSIDEQAAVKEVPLRDVKNKKKFTPIALASYMGNKDMFSHIVMLERVKTWSFGDVTEYIYPLERIDSVQVHQPTSKNGTKKNPRYVVEEHQALSLIASYAHLKHANLLKVSPMPELLLEKWEDYGRFYYYFYLGFNTILTMFVAVAIARSDNPGPNAPTNAARLPNEYRGSPQRLAVDLLALIFVVLEFILSSREHLTFITHFLRGHGSRYRAGYVVTAFSDFVFNSLFFANAVLRIVNVTAGITDPTSKLVQADRGLMAVLAFATAFRALNILRPISGFSTLMLMVDKMTFELRYWLIVYLVQLVGFSIGYHQLYYDVFNRDVSLEGSTADDLTSVGISILTMIKWTIGEFEYREAEISGSANPPAAVFLYLIFTVIMTIVLLNMLIAKMTNAYNRYQKSIDALDLLQRAITLTVIERRFSWVLRFSASSAVGVDGADCGAQEGKRYKIVQVRSTGTDTQMHHGRNLELRKQQPLCTFSKIPSIDDVQEWQSLLLDLSSVLGPQGYITNYQELKSLFHKYKVIERGAVSRDTAAFILRDLVELDLDHSRLTEADRETLEQRRSALQERASASAVFLDPDSDDIIPLETLSAFCRTTRNYVKAQQSSQAFESQNRTALVVVDAQRDMEPEGKLPMPNIPVAQQCIKELIRECRQLGIPIVFTRRELPPDHSSLAHNDSIEEGQCHAKEADDGVSELCIGGAKYHLEDDADDMVWPPHCVEGTEGAEFMKCFEIQDEDTIVTRRAQPAAKAQPGVEQLYSAFWHGDARTKESDLYEHLFDAHIDHVFVVGFGYETCVSRTAFDAAAFGFDVHVVREACTSLSRTWMVESDLLLGPAGVHLHDDTGAGIRALQEIHHSPVHSSFCDIPQTTMHSRQATRVGQKHRKRRYALAPVSY
eukprot:m.41016 g.41016  ORF g.41016 m.41016 type:complete len:1176 (+) comp10500_c0_seq3:86-3613(+)